MPENADPQTLIQQLLDSVMSLGYRDSDALDALVRRVEMVIRNVFGPDSKYLTDLGQIHYHPMIAPADEEYKRSSWMSGCARLKNLIQTMLEELTFFGSTAVTRPDVPDADAISVFIVHGHDEAMKVNVARTLEKLDLGPIILPATWSIARPRSNAPRRLG